MPPTVHIQFSDRLVSYETFMTDLTARLARVIKSDAADPEYISQRTAYSIFGRKNVDRWRRTGKVKPSKRPGKVEYCMADLRLLQRTGLPQPIRQIQWITQYTRPMTARILVLFTASRRRLAITGRNSPRKRNSMKCGYALPTGLTISRMPKEMTTSFPMTTPQA